MSNTVVIRAVVVVIGMTILSIVLLAIFREGDNTATILQIVGIVAPSLVAFLAFLQSSKNNEVIAAVKDDVNANTATTDASNKQIRELKVTVDGRLQQLLDKTQEAAHSAGVHQGEQDQRDRTADVSGPTVISPGGPTTIEPQGPVTIVVAPTDTPKEPPS